MDWTPGSAESVEFQPQVNSGVGVGDEVGHGFRLKHIFKKELSNSFN
jgi:hypothetical protein